MDFAFDSVNFKSLKSMVESLKPKSQRATSQRESVYPMPSPGGFPEG